MYIFIAYIHIYCQYTVGKKTMKSGTISKMQFSREQWTNQLITQTSNAKWGWRTNITQTCGRWPEWSERVKCQRAHAWLGVLTTRQRPSQGHEEITQVIGMTNETPPTRHQQTLPCCRGDGLEPCEEPWIMQGENVAITSVNEHFAITLADDLDHCLDYIMW